MLTGDISGDGILDISDVVLLLASILENLERDQIRHAQLRTDGETLSLVTDGSPAGIQLEVSGDFELEEPEIDGWQLYSSESQIIMVSLDGTPLSDELLFQYTGDLTIEYAIVAGWEGTVEPDILNAPASAFLYKPYPNPFNPTTTIEYFLPADGIVELTLYDIRGRVLLELYNGLQVSGYHRFLVDLSDQASGIYFLGLQAADTRMNQKLMLLK